MNFLHNMDISESTLRIDDHFLDLVDFETILTGKKDTNILIDLIGQVLDLSDLDTVHCTEGKERKKLDFTLRDINQAITISESGDNKLDKKFVSHKWMQCSEKTLGELFESTELYRFKIHLMVKNDTSESSFMLLDSIAKLIVPQSVEYLLNVKCLIIRLEEDADFPDTITTLIGQTFTFGVYVEKDNATAEGVCYKFAILVTVSQAITISESGDNKLDKKFVSHKWMQCSEKTLGELFESTELYRFKIHLMVKNDTSESSFMLLDSIAKLIVPQSVEYLLNVKCLIIRLEEDADFPDTITTLIGQTFTFGVYVEKDNATAEG
ncbi:hypothetical protein IGI04_035820, partial [Brassica rapa subsp. trilocularis]